MIRSNATALVGAALLAAACAPSEDPATGPVRIAVVGPASGPNALIGTEIQNTLSMVLAEVDSTVAGRELEAVFIDSESDPVAATAAYAEALQDPELNLVGGCFNWHSDVSLALMDVAADEGMAHVAALGASSAINEKYAADPERYAVWSKGWPTPEKLSANYVTAIEDAIDVGSLDVTDRTFAIYGEETSWGHAFGDGLRNQLEASGWTMVAEEFVAQDGIDYSDAIGRLQAQSPRIVVGTIASGSIYTFITQVRSTFPPDAQPLIVADGLGWNSDWYETLGDDSDGVVDQIPQFATQAARDFAASYRDQFDADASPSAGGLAYDYLRFMVQVLEEADSVHGEINRENVLDIHRNAVLTGQLGMSEGILMSRYVWDSESAPDPVIGGDAFTFPVLQYSSGESQVVWPETLRTGDSRLE